MLSNVLDRCPLCGHPHCDGLSHSVRGGYTLLHRKQVTVTRGKWCVSTASGYEFDGTKIQGVKLNVFKHHPRPSGFKTGPDGKAELFSGFMTQYGDADGMLFPDQDSATAYALDHGYVEWYRARTWCRSHRSLHTFLGKPSPVFDAKCWKEDWR